MYSGVPIETPTVVTFWPVSGSIVFAMPKSTTFTQSVPSCLRPIMMFSGFRSRWTMPSWCAAASASATCIVMFAARGAGNGAETLDRRRQRLALDVLHREVEHAVALAEVVDLGDVRMIDATGVRGFAVEAADRLGGVGERRVDDLDGALSA